MGIKTGRVKIWLLAFIVLLLVVYTGFIVFMGVRLEVLAEHPVPLLLYLFFAFLAELIRALRLKTIYEAVIGEKASLGRSFLGRLAGNIVSSLTPSAIGGELVRGAVVAGTRGIERHGWPKLVAAGLADGLYDLFTNTLLAAVFAPLVGLAALIPLLLGLAASSSWILGTLAAQRARESKLLLRLGLARLGNPLAEGAEAFMKGYGLRVALTSTLLSVLAWLLLGLGLYFILDAFCGSSTVLESIILLLYTYLMGIIPLPAGLGSMDIWLASLSCPEGAAAWRTAAVLQLGLTALIVGLLAAEEVRYALRSA